MKRSLLFIALAVSLTACGSSDPLHSTSGPSPLSTGGGIGKLSARDAVVLQCGDVTYVGPIRLPISVHGTTVNLSWLGNDNAVRGYEVQFELKNASNQWLPSLSRVVTLPEIEQFLSTEATYRVRVRGLFCGDAIGPFTDWQVFSTDGAGGDAPLITPPPICPSSVEGCYPPPPPPPGDDDDDDDDNPPPPPPVWEDVAFCHVEFHPGHGGPHPQAPYFTYQDKVAHNQHELDGHIGHHAFDYLGACQND